MARNLRNLTRNSLKYLIKNADNVKTLIADSTHGLQITIPDNNSSAFSIRTSPNILVIDTLADTIQMTGSVYISGSLYANEYNVDTITTTITNIDQLGSTKFGDTSDDTHQFTGSLRMSGGLDLQLPVAQSSAFTINDETGAYMTVSTVGDQNRFVQFNKPINIVDDTPIYFGSDFDTQIEYDEDGTDTLLVGGQSAGMTISDDFYLYFGTDLDAKIYYDEDNSDELIISGSDGGMSILGPVSSTDSVTIGSAAGSLVTVDTANMVTVLNESARVADDKKLYFGTNEDAYIEYDENGRDRLIVSGPSAGIEISGSAYHTGSYNLSGTLTLTGPSSLPMLVMDDSDASAQIGRTHLGYDGTNSDMAIFAHQDNANQTDFCLRQRSNGQTEINAKSGQSISFKVASANRAILKSSGHLNLLDDIKLIFGTNEDASIEYDENNTNKLILSGAASGFDINMADNAASAFEITEAGTSYIKFVTTDDQEEIIVNKNLSMRAGDLKIENDFHNATFESVLDDGSAGSAEILYYEPGADTAVTKGGIYFLHTDGTWDAADANAATKPTALLGIALGTSARDSGMLVRGFVKIPSTEVLNVPGSGLSDGLPVYISTTAAHIDFTAPSASGEIVRVVGYCIDDDSSDILLYFCPDNTWVEIA